MGFGELETPPRVAFGADFVEAFDVRASERLALSGVFTVAADVAVARVFERLTEEPLGEVLVLVAITCHYRHRVKQALRLS